MFISKVKLESFRAPQKITKELVADLIDVLKNNDTGSYILNNIVINNRILARSYLFTAYLYNLEFKILIERLRLLGNDEFTEYLLNYVNKMEDYRLKSRDKTIKKMEFILEQNFKANIKEYIQGIFNNYRIEKSKVNKEYRRKFLSKEY